MPMFRPVFLRVCAVRSAFSACCALAWVAAASLAFGGCASKRSASFDEDSSEETRTHLQEEARFQELRQTMRDIARDAAFTLPMAVDEALDSIPDVGTKSDLLALAASGGIFALSRCSAVDPRVGLADLTVSFSTVLQLFEGYAKDPQYKGLTIVIDALRPTAERFRALAEKWLPPEAMAEVNHDIAEAAHREELRVRTTSLSGSALAATAAPTSLQIESSFLSFNDNGLVEYGLGEMHMVRLSAQELSGCMALMPLAMEYRARRAVLWALQQSTIKNLEAKLDKATTELESLKELRSLQSLQSLDEVRGAPVKVGIALAIGLVLQAAVFAFMLRRRTGVAG